MAREDVDAAVDGLRDAEVWARPAGVASVGFHLAHGSFTTAKLVRSRTSG
jgi:hypothetical protein